MVVKLLQKKMLSLRFSSAVQSCHCKFEVDLGILLTVTAGERCLNYAKCTDKHHFWPCKSQYLEAFGNLIELTINVKDENFLFL